MYSTRAFWKKRLIGQVYCKGRNIMSQCNITDVILQNDIAGPAMFAVQTPVVYDYPFNLLGGTHASHEGLGTDAIFLTNNTKSHYLTATCLVSNFHHRFGHSFCDIITLCGIPVRYVITLRHSCRVPIIPLWKKLKFTAHPSLKWPIFAQPIQA